tara:strand:- start:247 stop:552 length:306 start_codon:yes stop_codon:yes gene_type:complete
MSAVSIMSGLPSDLIIRIVNERMDADNAENARQNRAARAYWMTYSSRASIGDYLKSFPDYQQPDRLLINRMMMRQARFKLNVNTKIKNSDYYDAPEFLNDR